MAVIMQWGPAFFQVVSDQIYRPNALGHTIQVEQKTTEDSEGTPPANPTPKKKEVITCDIDMGEAVGVRVRGAIETWRSLVGQVHTLLIGGEPYGPAELQLTSVAVSDMEIDDIGRMHTASLGLTFTEYAPEPAGKKSSVSKSSLSLSPGLSLNASSLASAKSALGIGPTAGEKQARKPANPMMEPM